jgi:DNA-binding NtrC family response regulator
MKKPEQNIGDEGYLKQFISKVEQRVILDTLREYGWVKKKVADALHISRTTLNRKLKKYGIGDLKKEVSYGTPRNRKDHAS